MPSISRCRTHARHLSSAQPVPHTTDSTIPTEKNDQPLIRVNYDVQSIRRIPRHPKRIGPPFHRKGHSVTPPDTGVSAELPKIELSPEPAMQRHPLKKLPQNLLSCHGACSSWRESDTRDAVAPGRSTISRHAHGS